MSLVVAAIGALGLVMIYAGITTGGRPRNGNRRGRLDRAIKTAGFDIGARRFLLVLCTMWAVSFVIVAGVTASLIISASIASAAVWAPLALFRSRAQKRRRGFVEAWPDAIAILTSAVRSGVALPEACIGLTVRGPKELAPGFEAFATTYRASGSFATGLHRLREVLGDPVADRVAVSLSLAHEVGGTDLVRVLRAIGDFVREDLRVRKEVEARWSWTVTAARVAAAAPWLVLLMMSTRPEAANAYDSVGGATVIAIGAITTLIGYRLMLRAARLPEEPRLPL